MSQKVHTHRFNGIRYHIEVDNRYIGWCDKPKKPDPKEYPAIRLPNGLPKGNRRGARDGLVTLIHECLHAERYSDYENVVDRVAGDIGRLLWRLGYRRG